MTSHSAVWPDVQPATLAGVLRLRAAERPEREAFVFLADSGEPAARFTYGELDRRARAIAAQLRESLVPGDRALLLYPPGLEFIAAFFGCLYAGVTAVPAYPPRLNDRSQSRLRAIAADAGPRAALTTQAIFAAAVAGGGGKGESFADRVPELAAVRWIATDGAESSEVDLEFGLETGELPEPDPGSVAFLQYTSGSTATPKGVMVTHANLVHNERMIGEAFRQDEETVVVGWLPLYHDMGLIGNVLQPLHAGARCVLMSPVAFLQQPVRWLRAISRFKGTTSGGPNFAYDLCVRRIPPEERAELDLSSWRVAFNGAEPVRVETLERFAEAFAPSGFDRAAFYPCYGLAEATLFVTGGTPGRFPRVEAMDAAALERHEARRISEGTELSGARLLVSSGRAWNGQRIAVVDPETAAPVPAGRVGEIWIAGPSVALGYWRNPEATASDFQARLATGEGPFLRTGDFGFLRDGELYVTGRLKDLIIIRGRNHYPQDLERTAERSHPDLRPGCGAAFSIEAGGEERLVIVHEVERRRRDGLEEVATAVRRAIAEEHQVQVQDVVLVRAGTVPKTSSGKIQRRACRATYQAGELAVVGGNALDKTAVEVPQASIALGRADLLALAPDARREALERLLRARAAAAVGTAAAEIDPAQPLTGLGLDSLGAMELKGGIEAALGVPVPLAELLEGIGTAGLADLLLPALEGEAPQEEKAAGSVADETALSWGERSLWFLHQLAPEGGAYNIAVAARAVGTLDVDALGRALDLLVARHEALRTVFVVPVEGAEPERRRAGGEGFFRRVDASAWSDAEVSARLAEEAWRPFSLDQGPLLRVLVLDRGERGEPILLLAVHHIAADFVSLGVIARDLGALYRQEAGGAAAVLQEPVPVSVHVRREREMLAGPRGERLWDFWRAMLGGGGDRGPVPDLDLPTDRPRPAVQTWNGGARTMEIPADLAERLRAFAAAHGSTLFMTLLAAFQAQLGRISGQEDFAVGLPFAGRGAPELAEAVGYLVNPVPLRADLAGDPAFAGLLARTRAAVVAGLEHGDFPFALLAERLRPVRDPSRSPLFQTMFLLQRDRPGHPGDLPGLATFALGESGGRIDLSPGLTLESLRLDERRAQLELTLRVAEERAAMGPARLWASLEYNSALFDGATAERMLGHFTTLLAGAVADPAASQTPISRLPLLTAAERTAVLVDWNAPTPGHLAGHRQDLLLHQPFEAQAARTPEAEALVAESRLTYAELSRRANQLAWHLQKMGVGPEVRVGVHLPRSADLVVSLLAVLKAGGAYVPLDPKYPRERLELMLADSGARLVIGDGAIGGREGWPGWEGWRGTPPLRVDLAAERDLLAAYSGSDPPAAALPGNLAYLIYTSGSTGRPKAVAVEHRSAAVMTQWARGVFAPAELAGVLAATSVAFDLSVFELFVPLSWGGRVILAENALELPRLAAAGEVTLVNTVPSAMAELVRGGGLPPSVRTVNLAGEPIPRALVDAVYAQPGVERFYNLYGPSEDTTYSTFALLAAGEPLEAPVSIGLPVDDTVAYVVDRRGEPVPVGVPGELWLGGAGLARGYLGRPELTAERFVPDPFGELHGAIGARLYRTGDLVRRRHDRLAGRLEFLGRIDHQVKIRGFRIELGEVEAALAAHPEVREAVVLALPEPGGVGRRLVAYVAGAQPAVLRPYLQKRLPDAFVPTAWVMLPALPLSPNGKVDRRALAAIEPQAASGMAAGPSAPVEEAVAGLFAEALGVPAVGAHDDFFALGGHSLLATRVLGRVARLFAVDLPVSALFQAPTAAALASRIVSAAGGAASAPPIVPVSHPHEEESAGFPLSFAQQRLWFLDQLQPGGAAYNMPGAVLLEGPLDIAALEAALSAVARRQESLRTRFASHGGRPVQIVDPPAPVALPVVDLAALPERVREAAALALAADEAARPFDLTHGGLLRAFLLRLAPQRHLKLLTLHHIVADGWSLGVLVTELAALYGRQELAPLAVGYADFAVWQRRWLEGGALTAQLAWWKERLAGAPTRLELPADHPHRSQRPAAAGTERGVHVHAPLAPELAARLRALSQGASGGATLFMVLLAAFEALLARVTGQDDLLLGSVVANRTRPETEGLIGLFANTVILRARLEDDPPFTTALARARETALGAWAHQDLPLELLVEELHPERETGRSPLFQAMLVLQNVPLVLELPGLTLRRVPVDSATAKFELTLEVTEEADGGLGTHWELSRDLFDAATGHRMAGWLGALLRGAVGSPAKPLSELPLLDEAERRQLLADCNPPASSARLATPVHRLFEQWAARAPERTAIVSANGGMALTYGELNARANRLARHLRALGVGPETRVGVAVERSPDQVTAFLAVLKAGGAYVPMDLSDPLERLAAMDAEAEVELMLSEDLLAADAEAVAAQAAENLPGPDPGTLAYVMFTSGSTGRPKAVAVEHRGIVRLVQGANFADLGPDQVFLQLAPTAFDASTLEIWGALLGGGRLVLAPGGVPSLDDLAALLEHHGVTTLWLTTGLFHLVVEERIGIFRGLAQLLTGGDVLSPEAVNRVLAELPGVRLVNAYGPTENTTFTTCHTVREPVPPGATVAIGQPISGTRVVLLDRRLRPVPDGVPGELLTGGAGLARGYLGRPDLTAERFVPDPLAEEAGEPGARLYRTGDLARWRGFGERGPERTLEFLRRADRQVKIRGFRVEPGEIEAVLAGHPGVARAAVLVLGQGVDRRLVAGVVAVAAAAVAGDLVAELKGWLAARLPSWLIPAVVLVPDLPLTASGKVDRTALTLLVQGEAARAVGGERSPATAQPVLTAHLPRNPTEELLAGILAEVLNVERVGIHDDFFALGGHSLLATRAVSRIVETLKIELPLSGFFATPTVAGLAERLRTAGGTAPLPPVVPVPRDHPRDHLLSPLPLSFAQQRLWFLDRLRPGSTAYNLPAAARLTGDLDAAVLERCLTEIVRRHEALRTVFAEDGGQPVQIVRPAGPAVLTCVDLSGLVETERWERALDIATREAALPFDLAAGPVVRFALVTLGRADHLLVAAFHHIAADGWSLPVFLGELAALYGAFAAGLPSPLAALPVQYGDFAVWQRTTVAGPAFARSLAFWRWRLADAEPLDLATDRPRVGSAGESGPLAGAPLDLAGLSSAVALRAREAGATRFMVVLCGVLGWLSRLTGQTDLTIVTPVAGRDRAETEGLIGFFANTLPLRTDLSGDPALADLLPRVRATVLEAYGNGAVPFERLVEELHPERSAGRTPFADFMLSYLSQPPMPAIPGLELAPLDLPGGEAKLDLEAAVYERDGVLSGLLEARADLFEPATLERMAAHLRTLLAGALEEPSRRLSELPLLSAAERQEIAAWGRAEADGGPEPGETVLAMIASIAERAPDAAAVEMGGAVLTYGGLIERAGRLARHLAALGVRPEAPVGVCLERSPEQVVAFLAVLAAGGVYLPLDPAYPRERLELLLADSGARVLVTRSAEAPDSFGDGEERAVVLLDQLDGLQMLEGEPVATVVDPWSLAYLIYTSGSSGRPKGVGVPHGALAAHCRSARQTYGLAPGDRCLGFASPGFDVAVEQVLAPLVSGATLVLSGARFWSPDELSRQSWSLGLTLLDLPTAYWQRWTAEGGAAEVGPAVRSVLVGGEEMAVADAGTWRREARPGRRLVELINGYGPTEAVITATQQVLQGSGDDDTFAGPSVPIGRPLPGRTAYVLDAAGGLLPAGAPGELALGGVLARGYHGAPALTAERFVPDPFGGIGATGAMGGARLYRTGDRARWRRGPAGAALEFLGRLDGQVKIRGFRIEVGEIEAALRTYPGVAAAAVLAVPGPSAGRRLAAWIVPAAGTDAPAPADLAAFLVARLPGHMIPVSFVCLDALPLTPHGKVDRRALAAMDGPRGPSHGDPGSPGDQTMPQSARTATEETLAGLWRELLGVERVGAHDDFFRLGGHSLLATQLTARVRGVFGVDLPLSELFAAPTLAAVALRIEAARGGMAGAAPPLRRREQAGDAPLSFAQQRLWFLQQLEPESPAYHVSGALHLTGPLLPGVLARALERIAARHEALRTVFVDSAETGGPVQRALPMDQVSLPLPVVDLRGLPATARGEAEAQRLGLAEARRLFDLERGPLFRALLLRLAAEEHLLVVVMHHIISDGWSMGVMMGELAALYDAFAVDSVDPLPELALQVADFAAWQRSWLQGAVLDHELAWWRTRLAEAPRLELPGDRPRPAVSSGRGGSLPVSLPADLSTQLHALARDAGATLFMTLLAGFAVVLQRWSGQDDLTVGSPIANRDRWEIEPLIGCFVNTLPLRVRLDGEPAFRSLLGQVRATTLGAYDHQGIPFEKLVEDLAPERDRAHTPLFQVMLVLQNAPQPPLALGGLTLALRELLTGTAKFDLTLSLGEEGGEVRGGLEYSADLFLPATAERLLRHLGELLRGAVADPGRRISELPLLTAAERQEILVTWNEAAWNETEGKAPDALLLSDLVAAQAARTPEATAVVGTEESLTYRELLSRADALACRLDGLLPAAVEARVGVCLERTPDLVVTLLAILRVGAAYVPLDPAYPRERLEFMLRDSGAGVLITQESLDGRCGAFAGAVLHLDAPDTPGPSRALPKALPGNLAYLIYTSGSTGTPKAVAIEHRSAVAMVAWALSVFRAEELAGVLFATSICFDLSVFELFVPLAAGGRVVVAANALALPELPAAGEVTLVNTVPSVMAELSAPGRRDGFPASVRTVNLAGEPLKGALADAVHALPSVSRVVNLYGPSEDTTYSTWTDVPPAPRRQGEPGIGRPVAGTRVYLLDRWGNPAPAGVPGELFLGGAGLARGYLGRPELTAERFVPDPFAALRGEAGSRLYRTGDLARWRAGDLDGHLEYLGRIDQQVKVRGFRIELGEIEAALARHPAVAEAVVLARDDEAQGRLLAAFLVPRPPLAVPPVQELRRFLRQTLPEPMVPAAFTELAALPLTPNGKIDRRTLTRLRLDVPAGGAGTGTGSTPRTPTEELLAALWCEVLGREQVGVHDSFFDLGGHSLLATRLVSRVRATFGSEIPLARLFDAPTIAELARVLDEARSAGSPMALIARTAPIRPIPREARGGDLPLSFAQERLWFLERIQEGAGVYNVPLALRLCGALDVSRLASAFGAIVARHEALRTVFPERDGDPVQRIQPAADPALWSVPVVDLAALPEPAAGEETRRLAIADSLVPFSLVNGPLLRTTLIRLAAAEHLLLLGIHHIVSDGWSLGVLLGELSAFYGGTGSDLPALPVQYADFAAWQREWLRGGELERQTAYWKRQLADAPALLELPADRPRPLVQSWRGAQIPVLLPAPLAARIAAAGRRQGATLFMLLLTAWDVLLHRHSGQRDLNVGTPIAGRNRGESERLIGFFVNTLVLRSRLGILGEDPPFADLLARTRRTALAAYDHQDLPFEKLVDELKPERTMSHQPLFQVMFALQNAPLGALELPGGLSLEPLELRAVIAKFDLTLSLMERRVPGSGGAGGNTELSGLLEYNADIFDAASVIRLLGHFNVLLEAIAGGSGAELAPPVSELPLLAAAERHQLLVEWSDGRPDPLGPCLHELFEATVAADPEAPAVVWEDVAWTYGELNRRANQLAWHLIALGVQPETRVGLCVERSAEMLVGMLGVLKAGGAYVPIDPAHPRERLAFMLEDTRAPVLITQERLRELLPAAIEARILRLDADWEEISRRSPGNPPPAALGTNPAYVIYTSGSTGIPKGVVTPHDAVVAYTQASSAVYGIRPGERNLQFSSISFDASVEEIYGCLTHGATLYVRGDVQEGISEFLERCRTQRITLLQFPTAFWHQLVTAMEAESLVLPPTIRAMFVGGEKMLAQSLVSWWKLLPPGLRFINAYGPTETTVAATLCQLPGDAPIDDTLREVPLGRPLVHSRGYVLDRELRPVPIGVTGELLIGGLGLARGYLDRPALTAEKFVPNPYAGLWGRPGERLYRTGDLVRLLPGGLLEFVGRADGQMKLRGYRIEPGEIEATLAGHPAVSQVVVLAREDAAGDVRLVAYAAAKGEPAPEPEALRDYLEERLPAYMVPQTVHVLAELPVSAQGKVDRLALARLTPEARRERKTWAAPQNEVEERIAAVWRELFGLNGLQGLNGLDDPNGIGVDDNFFDSGGSSLLLVKLHSRLQKALERTFPLVEIFKHPTIRTLAASLEAGQTARPSLDKARARTDTRRESMRQMQQLRDQRRGRTKER